MDMDSIKADIEEGQRLRGWIANSYAQIEFMLGDLLLRCRTMPEYAAEANKPFSHSAPKRVAGVRRLLEMDGPLSPFAPELLAILSRFEEGHGTRNLLAHGFCTFLHTPDGDAALQFAKWHRHEGRDDARLVRAFRLSDLMNEKSAFVALADEAGRLLLTMHRQLGWIARPAQ